VVVAGTDMTVIMRVQFHLDDKDSMPLLLEPNAPIAEYQIPANKKWMVLMGDNPLPDTVFPVVRTPHYSLVRLPEPEPAVVNMKLSGTPDPRFVSGIEGLSHAEPWGRWSNAKRVLIHFAQPLPRRAGVLLSAKAYDINATLPFTVRVGGQSKEVRLGWSEQHLRLQFDTDGSARTLEIDIPKPVSPEELGRPGDPRKLGIGISEITITKGADAISSAQTAR
jgi:phosphoglycerol transferase